MPPAVVAIDLDGTLIDADLQMDEADANAIRAAAARGICIVLATGRLYEAAAPFARQLDLRDPLIVLNGAAVYGERDGSMQMLRSKPLQKDVALRALDWLKEHGFHVQLYFGDRLYLDDLGERAKEYLRISPVAPVLVHDLRCLLTTQAPKELGPLKVLAVGSQDEVKGAIPLLAAHLGSAANVFRSQRMFLEVTDPRATKGEALSWIAAERGIPPQRVAAIGDSDNDVSMFAAAGQSFAVAGGTPAALAAAGAVVPAVGKGGVARALELVDDAFTGSRA